jgi:hypothetical protein
MIWQDFELDKKTLKTDVAVKLWQAERGFVEIDKNTLAIPIKMNEKTRGYVFHGKGRLLLDAIAETEEGAYGKSIEKNLDRPFLMLGSTGEVEPHFSEATSEDLTRMGYGNEEELMTNAEELFQQVFRRRRMLSPQCFHQNTGAVFAFHNPSNHIDFLIAKDDKIVYKAAGMIFISNRANTIFRNHECNVLCGGGRIHIIKA